MYICASQWVEPPAALTMMGVRVAPGPPLIVWRYCFVESTHPKVGMALLIRVGAKAQVWTLARRDAHSFLAVWAVSSIVL